MAGAKGTSKKGGTAKKNPPTTSSSKGLGDSTAGYRTPKKNKNDGHDAQSQSTPNSKAAKTSPSKKKQHIPIVADVSTGAEGDYEYERGKRLSEILYSCDDEINTRIAEAFMGTVVMRVDQLNPVWPSLPKNRELDQKQVDELKISLKQGARKWNAETRLKATAKSDTFFKVVKELVPEDRKDNIRGALTCNYPTSKKDFIVVPNYAEELPILECGQHRRAACMQMYEEEKAATGNSYGDTRILEWAVDFFAIEKLNRAALTSLRANKYDVYKPNEDGDVFTSIAQYLETLTLKERTDLLKNEQTLRESIFRLTGVNPGHVARLMTVLRNEQVRRKLMSFCETSFGRGSINITWAERMAAHKMNEIYFERIDDFLAFHDGVHLRKDTPKISKNDMLLLLEVQRKACPEQLKMLFFPRAEDYVHKRLQGPLKMDDDWFESERCPRLSKEVRYCGEVFTWRRPGFLASWDHDEYVHAWTTVSHKEVLTSHVDNWRDFRHLVMSDGETVRKILIHVMLWYMPDWKMPQSADVGLRNFRWAATLSGLMSMRNRKLASKLTDDPVPENEVEHFSYAVQVLRDLFSLIQKERSVFWKMQDMVEPKQVFGLRLEHDDPKAVKYLERFEEVGWMRVLNFVIERLGPCFIGFMEVMNDAELNVDAGKGPFAKTVVKNMFGAEGGLRGFKIRPKKELQSDLADDSQVFEKIFLYRQRREGLNALRKRKVGRNARQKRDAQIAEHLGVLNKEGKFLRSVGWDVRPWQETEHVGWLSFVKRALPPGKKRKHEEIEEESEINDDEDEEPQPGSRKRASDELDTDESSGNTTSEDQSEED